MKPILHFAPDNASLCVRLALEEAGVAYDTALVDRAARGQRAPGYLALNPNGLIPTLVTGDGPVFETAAILLWLAGNGGAALMPAPDAPGRGAALSWLFWLSNTLHPALRQLFYPDRYIDGGAQAALTRATRNRVAGMLDLLEGAAPDVLSPGTATLHTCYLCPMLRWLALYPRGDTDWFALSGWPGLFALARATETRPASLRATGAEGLGPTPFSAPRPPTPPIGSAT